MHLLAHKNSTLESKDTKTVRSYLNAWFRAELIQKMINLFIIHNNLVECHACDIDYTHTTSVTPLRRRKRHHAKMATTFTFHVIPDKFN